MARPKYQRYLVSLYNGKTEHKLDLTYSQKKLLIKAWKEKSEDHMIILGNDSVIRMNLSLFEAILHVPIVEPE